MDIEARIEKEIDIGVRVGMRRNIKKVSEAKVVQAKKEE